MMKKTAIEVLIGVLLLTGCARASDSEGQAIDIIESDLGKSINVVAVWYNKDENDYFIEFTSNGVVDKAYVDGDDKMVGYESVFESLADLSETAQTNEEVIEYSEKLINYPYDVVVDYNIIVNGEAPGWEHIE